MRWAVHCTWMPLSGKVLYSAVRYAAVFDHVVGCPLYFDANCLDAVWYAAVRYATVFNLAVSCPLYLDVTVLMRCGMPQS